MNSSPAAEEHLSWRPRGAAPPRGYPYCHKTKHPNIGFSCSPSGWQVAILDAPNPAAPGGRTTVYVLGMSHVSRRSCEDIEQLVGAVRPDIVLVELCKDRVTGLISEDQVRRPGSPLPCHGFAVSGTASCNRRCIDRLRCVQSSDRPPIFVSSPWFCQVVEA